MKKGRRRNEKILTNKTYLTIIVDSFHLVRLMMSEMCTLNSKKKMFAYDGGGKLAYKEDKIFGRHKKLL